MKFQHRAVFSENTNRGADKFDTSLEELLVMTVQSKYKRTSKEYQAMQAKKAELGVPPAVDFWTPVKDLEDKDAYKEPNTHTNY